MAARCCPRCKRESSLTRSYSILVTLANWPEALSVFCSLIIAGTVMRAGVKASLLAGLIAAIPAYMKIIRRQYCDRCRMEFRLEDTQELINIP